MRGKGLHLSDALRALSEHGVAPTYNQLWNAVVAGRVPAKRRDGKWVIQKRQLKKVAQAFLEE